MRGELRERIRCYGRTWGTGETWELGAANRYCVCVCFSTRGQIGKKGKNIMGEDK